MEHSHNLPIYYVVLVGIDQYPPGYRSLRGCVNDIDAIEQILFEPGVCIPAERIRIKRLAAPRPGHRSNSRFTAQTIPPTRANLLEELQKLAAPEVQPCDRVLFYYSGHGTQELPRNSSVWHEALVLHDGQYLEFLRDIEINALVNAIVARTSDVTVILDCCHSAGATRDFSDGDSSGADRYLNNDAPPADLPDAVDDRSAAGPARLLQALDPPYRFAFACQADERSGEGPYDTEEPAHGVFTYALYRLLQNRDAAQLAALRWADIWPDVLDRVASRCVELKRSLQHPGLIGRSEQQIFGGALTEPHDLGYHISLLAEGRFAIGAGTMMGVTRNAEIAVYGSKPARFPDIGSLDDQPSCRLKVIEAERSGSIAIPIGEAFELPTGARGRLVKPGQSERLRVAIVPEDPTLAAELGRSPLIEIVTTPLPAADVQITIQPDGSYIISNDNEASLALVPPGETEALRAGIESCYLYHTTLQLARNCNDLPGSLSLRILDCNNTEALRAMTPAQLDDPPLPEVGRDTECVYAVSAESRSCVRIANNAPSTLQVTLLNCSAGGMVELMGRETIRAHASFVFWRGNMRGEGFWSIPDRLPIAANGTAPAPYVTDRLVAIGTTRRDSDLSYLLLNKTVQELVDAVLVRDRSQLREPDIVPAAPVELWTATIVPLHILR